MISRNHCIVQISVFEKAFFLLAQLKWLCCLSVEILIQFLLTAAEVTLLLRVKFWLQTFTHLQFSENHQSVVSLRNTGYFILYCEHLNLEEEITQE